MLLLLLLFMLTLLFQVVELLKVFFEFGQNLRKDIRLVSTFVVAAIDKVDEPKTSI